ncbi:MAG: Uma2 family endonuclease [Chloroflexi bacterium]|nr:Uma2 family endonuclease [Chloroflexota bacterium]MBI2975672.1 Uma2 family endonuclease [Chloroflexota bacterium]MBI3177619.1 Uma2 family endonuclease [Chloroflexota bacterium]MBI4314733.1 Uma2 family endonuclease [Chloroflexota bacterium]MBI5292563.1 Uma2 family endonuclease [Chloroflexota bacterium]
MATQAPPATVITESQPGARPRMTYDEFLAWAGEDTHAEWVKGEVYIYMPVNPIHQQIVDFLNTLLRLFIEANDLGWLMSGPAQTKMKETGREPDLFFVSRDNPGQLGQKYFDGAPDLIVEVVSDDSVSRDRADKFEEYEDAGVKEYWIIDPRPRRRRADFFQMGADGKYQPVPVGADGAYRSQVLPGFWLKVSWLWEEPLPKLLPTLEEIQGK